MNRLKQMLRTNIPSSWYDSYLHWRLSPAEYRQARIDVYEKEYNGSIIRIGQYRYRLHRHESVSRNLYADRGFSSDLIHFLSCLLSVSGCFIDVGANIGSVSVPILSHSSLPALAIEPIKTNFDLLSENLVLNGVDSRVQTLQAAAGDRVGKVSMYISLTKSGDNHINYHPDETDCEAVEVPLTTLDTCIERYPELTPPFLIKVECRVTNPTYYEDRGCLLNIPLCLSWSCGRGV
jgi:FkbM family methyltransferase